MNKTFAIISAVVIVSMLLPGCGKKKPVMDLAAANEGVAAVNSQLPVKLGIDLTLTKATVVGDQVEFDYMSPYPSKAQIPARATALMRGSMLQYACGNAAARKILNAGYDINHRVIDADGHDLLATVGNLAVCANY